MKNDKNRINLHLECPADVVCMGAICGDVAGSAYEFHPVKNKSFKLYTDKAEPTDDSIMTLANMRWLANKERTTLVAEMQDLGHKYPMAGYGGRFYMWLANRKTEPYNSYGNGSAMRVSPVAWAASTLDEVLELAKQSAEVTHDHPEGIKGAQAAAAAIFLARQGRSKAEIKQYIEETFGYNLSRTLDEIRPRYFFDETCQGSVPESIICFLEGESYEDTIRNAISLGGDADTMAAIAGAIAEAAFGIPDEILEQVWGRLDERQQQIVIDFQQAVKAIDKY